MEKVYTLLEENIINMTLPPGDNLVEEDIARSLDISRSPVREALVRLETACLVRKSKKGRVVASITEADIINNYEIWEMMESFAGGLASQVATVKDLGEIERILGEMKSVTNRDDSFPRYRDLNYQFHYHLVAPCPNQPLVQLYENALKRIHWCYNLSISWHQDLVVSYSEHTKIFEAYRAKQHESFEKRVRAHIRKALKRLRIEYSKKRST
ncbi:MAG: GntR family transcriptional regulator [Deltaproteobacteria bacterium]|nr:MAG: GntR family transcriptional regulator [Deltaproteobacteria bacterium]